MIAPERATPPLLPGTAIGPGGPLHLPINCSSHHVIQEKMADSTSEQAEAAVESTSSPSGKSMILGKLILLAVLASIVAAECIAASFFLPSAEETAAIAGMESNDTPEQSNGVMDELAAFDAEVKNQVEVDLGEFTVTAFQPLSNTTMRIDFHLYGTISKDDEETFRAAWDESQHRLRDQVIVTLRASELGDLTDAGLGLIKRRILEKTNRALGKPYLRSVIFSNFSFIEQ
jgi:flagellar FliL protein